MLGIILIAVVLMSDSAFTKSLHSSLFTLNVTVQPCISCQIFKNNFLIPQPLLSVHYHPELNQIRCLAAPCVESLSSFEWP